MVTTKLNGQFVALCQLRAFNKLWSRMESNKSYKNEFFQFHLNHNLSLLNAKRGAKNVKYHSMAIISIYQSNRTIFLATHILRTSIKKQNTQQSVHVHIFIYFVCKRSSVCAWFSDWIPCGFCIAFAYCLWLWPPSLLMWALCEGDKQFPFFTPFTRILSLSPFWILKTVTIFDAAVTIPFDFSLSLSLSIVTNISICFFVSFCSCILAFAVSCLYLSIQTERIKWIYRFSYFFDFMSESALNIITHFIAIWVAIFPFIQRQWQWQN